LPGSGRGGSADLDLDFNSSYTIETPTAAGVYDDTRTFLAWTTESTGGNVYYPGDIITICDDLVLYAQWQSASGGLTVI